MTLPTIALAAIAAAAFFLGAASAFVLIVAVDDAFDAAGIDQE